LTEVCRFYGSCSRKGERGGTEAVKRKRDNERRKRNIRRRERENIIKSEEENWEG
jgi:hypothetical protein